MSVDIAAEVPAFWPHRDASEFVTVGSQRWHVQRLGAGPQILLVHGTGASSHSWAGVAEILRERFAVLLVDLPGHGLSDLADSEGLAGPGRGTHRRGIPGESLSAMSLPGMAQQLTLLLKRLDADPVMVAGHSAGAAVLARMCLDKSIQPQSLVSANGALLALPGLTGRFFSGSARLLAAIPAVPSWVAGLGGKRAFTDRLIQGTGSTLGSAEVELYRQLVSSPRHVSAALKMMAAWDLEPLENELPGLRLPVHLIACENDRTVPPAQSVQVQARLPNGTLHSVPGLGHLGHEEEPALFARLLGDIASQGRSKLA